MGKPNLSKLKERYNRLKNKGSKGGWNKDASPFFSLAEGTNRFRLLPWPDAEEDEDGTKIPDFKEQWFYYGLKFVEKLPDGSTVTHKAPLSLRHMGEEDCVQDAINMLFDKEGKSEEQVAEDKELAKKLLPGQTMYLLGIDRSKEDEGPKMWSISSKKIYETVIKVMLDEKKGPAILDTSGEGFDLEIEVIIDDQKRKQVTSVNPAMFDGACPVHEDEDKAKEWIKGERSPDPYKLFAKRKLTPAELRVHFDKYMGVEVDEGEGTELKTVPEKEEATPEEKPAAAAKKSSAKKASKKASDKKEAPTNINEAFAGLDVDDDED